MDRWCRTGLPRPPKTGPVELSGNSPTGPIRKARDGGERYGEADATTGRQPPHVLDEEPWLAARMMEPAVGKGITNGVGSQCHCDPRDGR